MTGPQWILSPTVTLYGNSSDGWDRPRTTNARISGLTLSLLEMALYSLIGGIKDIENLSEAQRTPHMGSISRRLRQRRRQTVKIVLVTTGLSHTYVLSSRLQIVVANPKVGQNLNGLKLVVRFEVDACVPSSATKSKGTSPSDIDALADAFSHTSLTSSLKKMSEDKDGLCIRQGGILVDQDNLAELTTISKRRRDLFDWAETYPQLFLSQSPNHFLGVHERGRFEAIEQRKLGSDDLRSVEQSLQGVLWQLRYLLDTIKALVVKHGKSGRLSLVCQGGELMVYKRSSADSCLPEDILARFDN